MILIIGNIEEIFDEELHQIDDRAVPNKKILVRSIDNESKVIINIWGKKINEFQFDLNNSYVFCCKGTSNKGQKGWFTSLSLVNIKHISDLFLFAANEKTNKNTDVKNETNRIGLSDLKDFLSGGKLFKFSEDPLTALLEKKEFLEEAGLEVPQSLLDEIKELQNAEKDEEDGGLLEVLKNDAKSGALSKENVVSKKGSDEEFIKWYELNLDFGLEESLKEEDHKKYKNLKNNLTRIKNSNKKDEESEEGSTELRKLLKNSIIHKTSAAHVKNPDHAIVNKIDTYDVAGMDPPEDLQAKYDEIAKDPERLRKAIADIPYENGHNESIQ